MKNKNNICCILFVCGIINFLPCIGQETYTYKAIVRDSITKKVIPAVSLYVNKDTVGIKNRSDGFFQLRVKKGETIRFRKAGYRWLDIKFVPDSMNYVEMVPSKPLQIKDQFDEVEVDGRLIPKNEWNDINQDYIGVVSVSNANNKSRLIIETK